MLLVLFLAQHTLSSASSQRTNQLSADRNHSYADAIEYEHVGCFLNDADLQSMNHSLETLETLDECIERCYDFYFDFAAVIDAQNDFKCYCADDELEYKVRIYSVCLHGT